MVVITLKYISIVLSISYVVWGQENRIFLSISTPQVLELRKCAASCGEQYGVDPNDLRKILSWTMPKDKPHKQFLYCIFVTSKYIAEDGHFNVDKSLELKPINGTLEETKTIFEDCNKITKENELETVQEMDACFHRHFVPIVNAAMKTM